MEPEVKDNPIEQIVLVKTHPVYALCNVHFLLSKPLANSFDHSMQFVNAAGGVSEKYTLKHSRKRGRCILITRSILEDKPVD